MSCQYALDKAQNMTREAVQMLLDPFQEATAVQPVCLHGLPWFEVLGWANTTISDQCFLAEWCLPIPKVSQPQQTNQYCLLHLVMHLVNREFASWSEKKTKQKQQINQTKNPNKTNKPPHNFAVFSANGLYFLPLALLEDCVLSASDCYLLAGQSGFPLI